MSGPPETLINLERKSCKTEFLRSHRPGKVYCGWKANMAAENLAAIISSLTPEEQESVKHFVDFLRRKGSVPSTPFLAAVEEFIDQHPELLRRLAQ
jgi:hypothetical protein